MNNSPHRYGNIDPYDIPDIADRLLNEYWDIAESVQVKTFLCFGTCLGFIRDGGYIPGDNDIDVGIMGGIDRLIPKMIENGFEVLSTREWRWHFLKENILIDVCFDYPESLRRYSRSFGNVEYGGRMFNVPFPIEEYLKARYGDWKTKMRKKEV